MADQRVKGGRPRKHSPDAKRPTMAFRMGSRLHERLIASAAVNERSLSEEIERILEAHFAAADQRTIIREEIRAAMDEHEANLAVARVRRSAALEELARLDGEAFFSDIYDRTPGAVRLTGSSIGRNWRV